MESDHNLETSEWVGPRQDLLLLRGWAIQRDGSPVTAVRLSLKGDTFEGYHGIRRPDIAHAYPGNADGIFSGFSIVANIDAGQLPATLEAKSLDGTWHLLRTIECQDISGAPNVVPVKTEALGWNDKATTPADPASRPVLFISHDFAFAGAQVILLRLLRWLRAKCDTNFEILIAVSRDSASRASTTERHLLDGFNEVGPVHFLSDLTHAPENLALIRRGHYRLIYANTGTLGWLLPSLRPFACPVISSVYELGFWLKRRTGQAIFNRQAAETDLFLAGGKAVRDLLVNEMAVPAHKTEVVYACASTERAAQTRLQHSRDEVRRALGIPADAFVLEACGTFDWRKGAELFVPICVALRRKLSRRDFRAIWIGDTGDPLVRQQFLHDIEAAGLAGNVSLVEPQPNLPWWMLAADCFALPSREDPFPMVMLEAGVLGLPVVGFQGSGGVTEYAGADAGLCVPYLDVEAFAEALAALAFDPDRSRALGRAAEERATNFFDEEISFQRIREMIAQFTTQTVTPP